MVKKLKVRRGCIVPNQSTWPTTKKSNRAENVATTGSVDGCSILPETKLLGTHLRMDTAWALSVGGCLLQLEQPERGQSLTSNHLLEIHS